MDTFKAIVPINDFHRKILRIYAGFMADTGAAPLTVWHSHPYRMMGLFEQPGEDFTRLQVTMTQNERRPEVFNITNMGQEAEEVELEISHLIGDTRIYQVEYIDTREGEVVASALIPLKQQGGIYKTNVPAGMTRQIWLSIDSGSTNPGTYDSRIGIRTKSLYKVIKLEVDVIATHSSNYSDCSMVMWDYVYNKKYGITANNQIAAMEDIKSRPVDTVCCVRSTLPIPKRKDVDRDGNLTAELDFTRWDSFLEMFPGKSYLGYVSCKRLASFAGQKFGTAGFERILSQWAAAWANHNRSIGL
ncbi:hypothetical protein KA005_06915, partial [bacterium]|nr:hypothetical protein [bacterium]